MSSISSSRRSSSVPPFWSLGSATRPGCIHGEQTKVICVTCSQPLCQDCLVSGEHCGHIFKTVEDECKHRKDKMARKVEELASKAKDHGNLQQWVERQKDQLDSKFKQVRESLTEKYEELQGLLDLNRDQAIKLLEAQRDSQRKGLYCLVEDEEHYRGRFKDIQTEIAHLNERGSSQRRQSSEWIQEIEAYQMSIDLMNEFYKRAAQKSQLDKSRLEALEESIQRIVKTGKDIFPRPWEFYEDITLNPSNTADKSRHNLLVACNHVQVSIHSSQCSNRIQKQPEVALVHILAEQSWKEGRHYWEVDVENCHTWAVGVVELAKGEQQLMVVAGGNLGQDRSSWVLEMDDGELAAVHNGQSEPVKEREVKCLGLFLDMTKNKSCLTFYDVNSCLALHTFYPRFKKNVFPVFSLSSTTESQSQSLALCNLDLQQPTDVDSGVEMSRSSLSMSDIEYSDFSECLPDVPNGESSVSAPESDQTTSV